MTAESDQKAQPLQLAGSVVTEYPLRASFALYAPGDPPLRVQLTFQHVDMEKFPGLLEGYLGALEAAGFSRTEPGLEPGEDRQMVIGLVMGCKESGEPLAWLYREEHPNEFKVATIWVEHLDEIPAKFDREKIWEASAAPKLSEARARGFFQEARFPVVMKDTGKVRKDSKDREWPVYEFARIVAGSPGAADGPAGRGDAKDETPLDQEAAERQRRLQGILHNLKMHVSAQYGKLPKFAEWCSGQLGRAIAPNALKELSDEDIEKLERAGTAELDAGKQQPTQDSEIPF